MKTKRIRGLINRTVFIDGKKLVYNQDTVFAVAVGRGKQGSFKIRYVFKGNPGQAVGYYRCINIGKGYKKRLSVDGKPFARSYS